MDKVVRFRCNLCEENVDAREAKMHREVEDWVLEAIKECHPDWAEPDGSCPKCIVYYKNLPSETNSSSRTTKKGG